MVFTPTGTETPEDIDDRIAEINSCAPNQGRRKLRLCAELADLIDSYRARIMKGEALYILSEGMEGAKIMVKLIAMKEAKQRAQDAIARAYFGEDLDDIRMTAAKGIFGAQEVPGGEHGGTQ